MNKVSEQIESSDPQPERSMSPEAELVFNLINGINQAYLVGLTQGLGTLKK